MGRAKGVKKMFAVPKDTQLLVFFLPFADEHTAEIGIEILEAKLTKRTGIPCVVIDRYVHPEEEAWGDLEIAREKKSSAEQSSQETQQADIMLRDETSDERNKGDHRLDQRKPGLLPRKPNLSFGLLVLNLIAPFLLGLLVSFLLNL